MRMVMRTGRVAVMVVGLGVGLSNSAWANPAPFTAYEASSTTGVNPRTQGYLGVDIRDVGDEEITALKLKESRGARVIRVDHDGPAGKAGLQLNDVILQMNGTLIEGEDQLRRMLRETPAGHTATLEISRDGQLVTVKAQLGNRAEVERQAWQQRWIVPEPTEMGATTPMSSSPSNSASGASSQPSTKSSGAKSFFSPSAAARSGKNLIDSVLGSSYTGAMVETLGPQLAEYFGCTGGGVLVHSVDANSPAANAGLHAGDVVVRANAVKLNKSDDWLKVVRENKGKSVPVVVLRDKKEQTLTLVPDGKKRSSVQKPEMGDQPERTVAHVLFSFR